MTSIAYTQPLPTTRPLTRQAALWARSAETNCGAFGSLHEGIGTGDAENPVAHRTINKRG